MSNIEVRYEKEDARPAIILDEVKGADFIHVKADHASGVPVFSIKNSADFNLYMSRPLPDKHLAKAAKKEL